jgi:hypothetical protein
MARVKRQDIARSGRGHRSSSALLSHAVRKAWLGSGIAVTQQRCWARSLRAVHGDAHGYIPGERPDGRLHQFEAPCIRGDQGRHTARGGTTGWAMLRTTGAAGPLPARTHAWGTVLQPSQSPGFWAPAPALRLAAGPKDLRDFAENVLEELELASEPGGGQENLRDSAGSDPGQQPVTKIGGGPGLESRIAPLRSNPQSRASVVIAEGAADTSEAP